MELFLLICNKLSEHNWCFLLRKHSFKRNTFVHAYQVVALKFLFCSYPRATTLSPNTNAADSLTLSTSPTLSSSFYTTTVLNLKLCMSFIILPGNFHDLCTCLSPPLENTHPKSWVHAILPLDFLSVHYNVLPIYIE